MNLKSLALTLGISKTTVSRALNGYPEVNVRTRERVLAAAKEAGYEANPLARSLAVGRTNVVGMVYQMLPNVLGDPMFLAAAGGMSQALEARKLSLIIAPVSAQNEMPTYEQLVRGKRVDGLIVSRTQVHDERIAYLAKIGFPFVAHGRTTLDQPYAWFDYDNAAGMRAAVECLLGLGHQRLALISAPLKYNFAAQRRDSFVASMGQAGLGIDPRHLHDDVLDRRSGYQAMQALLACSVRPTAVIVDNHLSGVGAIRALKDAGLQMGKEMSIIVWGSIEDSLVGANITTIDLPDTHLAGGRVADMVADLVSGTPIDQLQELWQPVLVPGDTVGRRP
jgi:LacI family transcriptional regulator